MEKTYFSSVSLIQQQKSEKCQVSVLQKVIRYHLNCAEKYLKEEK